MAQAADIIYDTRDPGSFALRVTNGATLYKGTLVGRKAGLAIEWVGTDTAMEFLGLNGKQVTGNTSAAVPPEAEIDVSGRILRAVTVAGSSAVTNQGALVYASDGDSFTLTATTNGRAVATVLRWHTSTTCDIQLLRPRNPAGGVAVLTEDGGAIGGTNDGDLPALVDPNGDAGASVIAAIRENAAKINEIAARL